MLFAFLGVNYGSPCRARTCDIMINRQSPQSVHLSRSVQTSLFWRVFRTHRDKWTLHSSIYHVQSISIRGIKWGRDFFAVWIENLRSYYFYKCALPFSLFHYTSKAIKSQEPISIKQARMKMTLRFIQMGSTLNIFYWLNFPPCIFNSCNILTNKIYSKSVISLIILCARFATFMSCVKLYFRHR